MILIQILFFVVLFFITIGVLAWTVEDRGNFLFFLAFVLILFVAYRIR